MLGLITWVLNNLVAINIGLIIGAVWHEKFGKLYADAKKFVKDILDNGVKFVKDVID